MDAVRRSFFFGATLSEIGFILFFALLLFAFFQKQQDLATVNKTKQEKQELAAELAAQKAALAEVQQLLGFGSEEERQEYFSTLVSRQALMEEKSQLQAQNEELKDQLESYKELQQIVDQSSGESDEVRDQIEEALKLKKELQERGFSEEMSAEELATALAASEVIEGFNESSPEPIKSPEDLRKALEDAARVGDLEGRVVNLTSRLGGRDLPPCWADRRTGRVEFLFDLVITDEGLVFSSAAPSYRFNEYQRLPNTSELTAGILQLEQFKELAGPILALSDQRQCRHYVAITDKSVSSYKATLTVEDYFYKFVNRT